MPAAETTVHINSADSDPEIKFGRLIIDQTTTYFYAHNLTANSVNLKSKGKNSAWNFFELKAEAIEAEVPNPNPNPTTEEEFRLTTTGVTRQP